MACAALVFDNITQSRFDCLVQEAAASGIKIDGNTGIAVVDHGIIHAQISWNYDPGTQTLTLQYLNPRVLAGCDKVNGMLQALVDSCP